MKYYRIFSVIVLIILIAINVKIRIPATPQVNENLVKYVETFKKLCKTYQADCSKIDDFKIELKDMSAFQKLYEIMGVKGYVIGHCWTESNEIDINIDYYNKSLPIEIEQLVIHELGHCVLDLDHTEENSLDIMNPYSLYHRAYFVNYNELMNRFFSCIDFCPVVQFNESQY